MKKIFVLLIMISTALSASAYTTDASKFAENQYNDKYGVKPKIKVIKEHTEKCEQKIGDITVPAITYGYGTMKVKGERKCRISYICLLDKDCNPIWSYVIQR